MAQEYESPGSEYNQPGESREAEELRAPAPEAAAPAGELGIDRKSAKSAAQRKAEQKEKQKKHHKLLKKMVYAAASAVAVVGLSQSVGTQTQSAAGSAYAVYIGTDGIFPHFENEDGDGGSTSYLAQTRYYYYSDYEISERTTKAVVSEEGYDFAYEITYLPMSALEKRDGISFDEETYTLTLEDYTNTILYVTVSETNDENTLTIRLEGVNELGYMSVVGVENVIFTGAGSLELTGISERYNVATGTYEDGEISGHISIHTSVSSETIADYYPKVFVGDDCSVTAGYMFLRSSVPFTDEPVSGNLQWEDKREYEGEEYYRYYNISYDNVSPLTDAITDTSNAAADADTQTSAGASSGLPGETENAGTTGASDTSSTESSATDETTAETVTGSWLRRDPHVRSGSVNSEIGSKQIVSITFLDSLEEMPTEAWDVSNDESATIMAWVTAEAGDGTDEETTYYDLYIAAEGNVKAGTDCSRLFSGYANLETIHFDGNFDTSDVTDMSYMFSGCSILVSLDLSSLDTSGVTDMSFMFSGCKGLTSLDLSGFDTSNVTDMSNMFGFCTSLTSLDLSSFDTSNVTDMSYMFSNCTNLTSLDLSNFDTSSVTNMGSMFASCHSLTSIDVSSFNTSNVIYMGSMFHTCSSLTSLDLSNFNTSKVITMYRMFYSCGNLTDLDISSFDMSAIEGNGAAGMFSSTPLADQY